MEATFADRTQMLNGESGLEFGGQEAVLARLTKADVLSATHRNTG